MQNTDELERWNQRYSSEEYFFGLEPNEFLCSQSYRFSPKQKVLALADGEGRNGVWLASLGLDVLSVDISPIALEKAQHLAASRGVTLTTEVADLSTWRWGIEQFDAIIAIFIQFASPDLRRLIFEGIKASLKTGGLLILVGYTPKQLEYKTGGPPYIENMYSEHLLRESFSEMEFLHLEEYEAILSEGVGHSGMSALISLVARK
ncbi:class I SAM-dependent methyltransferase [Aetokthonos hydrillicola Thurmond2011]|jgi:SAM-dependent methyltransferase|uniref:Class I SAM-dependent methyltransferase n=1 Tax=Aetokthonos hydrillicola Thurmond2011 TaxID=2712845 RepID=A0AAP5ICS1_9CYAN|nr:class I SAM-dependent methyltransferase [Aetokthonos hydrillicola]MBO3458401.1 class I SAM-dependent methyltransferase [Aetokthonos hydrillicola CCALA 1050]MBW4586059.1 class I SAM-dependent methyltransferase [Aetokthonos hydrillicola CCALA 1050]MDR9897879.1 class I SAM-dependent methyltransferase [Aetokthonos hydrillicola Thurmond2011]